MDKAVLASDFFGGKRILLKKLSFVILLKIKTVFFNAIS